MSAPAYPSPVDRLLVKGDASGNAEWPDYLALGLTDAHVPDLIRMALDEKLHWADSDSREVWAPIHAWRALGQLRAVAAVEPLLSLLPRIDDDGDDWVGEDMPEVFGLIGPAAVPALAAYLADDARGLWARVAAAHGLSHIGTRHPEARAECVASLAAPLERSAWAGPGDELTLNGYSVSFLMDLKAVEAAPLIERAFAAGRVDETVMGDWEDAQIKLGLKAKRERPRMGKPLLGFDLREAFDQAARSQAAPTSREAFELRAQKAVLNTALRAGSGPRRKRRRGKKK